MHFYKLLNDTITSTTIVTNFYKAKFLMMCDGNGNYTISSIMELIHKRDENNSPLTYQYFIGPIKNIAINCASKDVGNCNVLLKVRQV